MTTRPHVTIITVTFNNRAALARTVDSVRGQTYAYRDHIIIDGGSKDGTAEYLNQKADCFSYWQSRPDKGLYDAMNQGLDHAKGNFCVFLNAGDVFYTTETLATMAEALTDPDTYYFGTAIMTDGAHVYRLNPASPVAGEVSYRSGLPNHQASFFPRSFYVNARYDLSFRMAADDDYKIRAIQSCPTVHVDQTVVIFAIDGMSRNLTRWKFVKNRVHDTLIMGRKHFADDYLWRWRSAKFLMKTFALFLLQRITGPHWRYELYFNKFKRIPKNRMTEILDRVGSGN
jgi:glycosyltransferase involved in cell wall biosynthesis